jgi:hypothetical protein
VLFLLIFTFQRDGFQVFKKDISWAVKLIRLWKIYKHFKGAEREFTTISFVK